MEPLEAGTGPAALYQSHTSVPEACRRTIAAVQTAFARELTLHLSAYLRSTVAVKFTGLDERTFTQFLGDRKPSSCAATIKAPGGNLLMDLDPTLLFAFVELMLGGKALAGDVPDRPPTEIEKQLLSVVLKLMTSQLERAWAAVGGAALQFGGIESSTQVARFMLPPDAVVIARFDVSAGEQNGALAILTPTHAAEALAATAEPAPAETAEASDATRISQTVMDSSVHVDVWLDGVSLELRDLVQLREGYVVKFDHPTDRNLQCTFNGVPGFPGQVVSTGRKRAFLIQDETT